MSILNSALTPGELAHTPEGYILSGIGAVRPIEHTIATALDSGLYLVELDEIGALERAPEVRDLIQAYALECGCPALPVSWSYDYETHQFRAIAPEPYFARLEPQEIEPERREAIIANAQEWRALIGRLRTERLHKSMRLSDSEGSQAQSQEASTRDVNRCG